MIEGGAMPPFDDPAYAEDGIGMPAVHTGPATFDHQRLIENIQNPNIAEDLPEDDLSKIGQKVRREFELDLGSRAEWEQRSEKAMELAMQVAKQKTSPWVGASNVIFPLMTTAAVQFAARAYPGIIQGRNVVKGVVIGDDQGQPMINPQTGQPVMMPGPNGQPQPAWIVQPGAKKERANRIGEHMSWQLLEEMTEWDEEMDKMLHILPIIGCAFRKSLYDPSVGHNASMLVMAQNLVVNYFAKSMERAPRLTEQLQFYPYEIEEQIRAKLFLDHNYGTANNTDGDEDAPHDFLEQHRWIDLDEDGYPEPYICTVHKQTGKVARIVARYDAEGVHISRETGEVAQIDPVHYYTKFDFLPNPDGGIYGVGFGQLLGPINESINTTLNMMFDAGNLQNAGGGFIGRGPSLHSGNIKFKLGEWKMLNVPGQTVREAIVPLQHPGPSAVLFSLLGMMIEAGKEVASINNIMSGDITAQSMQPTTALALIEQGQKVFTGIVKRVYGGLGKEFNKLYRLNRIYLDNEAKYKRGGELKSISREDYADDAGVEPVADPNMATDMQKMGKASFLQSLQGHPNIKSVEIVKRVLDAAQIEKPEELIQEETGPNPMILQATAELEAKQRALDIQEANGRVAQIKDWSQAVLNLAKADAENGSQDLAWTAQHIELYRIAMESLMQPAEGKAKALPAPQPPPQFDPLAPDPALAGYGYPQQ
jgi:chaperonin GroES